MAGKLTCRPVNDCYTLVGDGMACKVNDDICKVKESVCCDSICQKESQCKRPETKEPAESSNTQPTKPKVKQNLPPSTYKKWGRSFIPIVNLNESPNYDIVQVSKSTGTIHYTIIGPILHLDRLQTLRLFGGDACISFDGAEGFL